MIKENQRLLNIALVLIDVLVVVASLACSFWLRFHTVLFGPIGGHLPLHSYVLFLVFAVIPIYLILYFAFGLYKPRRTYKNIFSEATQIIKVNIVAFFGLVSVLFIINEPDFSRIMLILLAIIASCVFIWGTNVAESIIVSTNPLVALLRSLLLLVVMAASFVAGYVLAVVVIVIVCITLVLLFCTGALKGALSGGGGGSSSSSSSDDKEVLDFGMGDRETGTSSWDKNTFYGDSGRVYDRQDDGSWTQR
jgi:hypothetical protein